MVLSPCTAGVAHIMQKEHVLLVVQHHAISDGWSLSVLGRDLAAAYNAIANGMKPQWPPLPVQQVDYAVWQRQKTTPAALRRGACLVETHPGRRANAAEPARPTGRALMS